MCRKCYFLCSISKWYWTEKWIANNKEQVKWEQERKRESYPEGVRRLTRARGRDRWTLTSIDPGPHATRSYPSTTHPAHLHPMSSSKKHHYHITTIPLKTQREINDCFLGDASSVHGFLRHNRPEGKRRKTFKNKALLRVKRVSSALGFLLLVAQVYLSSRLQPQPNELIMGLDRGPVFVKKTKVSAVCSRKVFASWLCASAIHFFCI